MEPNKHDRRKDFLVTFVIGLSAGITAFFGGFLPGMLNPRLESINFWLSLAV
jgi:hypothetical protein